MTQKDSLYIKACVIANGLQDQQGDVITKQDIKRIFTNSIDVGFDLNHDNIRQGGVYSLEQYISKSAEKLGERVVPEGSWMTVIRIDNPEIKSMINKQEIKGVSITAYPEKGAVIKRSHPKVVLYKDILEKEKIHPKEISLVEKPSNLLPLEVMDYTEYISKSVKENTYMNETETDKIMKQSTTDKILDILQQLLPNTVQKEEIEPPVEQTGDPTSGTGESVEEEMPEQSEEETPEEIVDKTSTEEEETSNPEEETPEQSQTTEEEIEETEQPESVEKMMQPNEGMGMTGGSEYQAIVQIAQICARILQGQQQQQQPPQNNGIMQSEDADPTEPIQKGSQLQDKVTGKLDNVVSQDYVDRAVIFAKQTGRDPYTGEKL
jgi:hypothetical protein